MFEYNSGPASADGKFLKVGQTVTITGVITNLNGAVDNTTEVSVQLQQSGNSISVLPEDIAAASQYV